MSPNSVTITASDFLAGSTSMNALVSLDGRLAFSNPALIGALNGNVEQLFGFPIHSVLDADQIALWEDARERLIKTVRPLSIELVLRGFHGNSIPARGEAWPVFREGRLIAIGLTLFDTRSMAQISHPTLTRAQKDELTGLLNRQGFVTKCLDTLAAVATMNDTSIKPWIVACNIKHYQRLCEAGADIAAVVLKEVANALRASVRGHDVIGRIDGDLFGALLMLPPSYSPTMVIARLRAAIKTRKNTMKLPDEIDMDVRINPIQADANWEQIQQFIDPAQARSAVSSPLSNTGFVSKAATPKPVAANKPHPLAAMPPLATNSPLPGDADGDSAFI